MIYWMLNNAWPGLHWNLWDYYMRPAGSYFGAKAAGRMENAVFDYVRRAVWLVNRSLDRGGKRKVEVEVMDRHGKVLHKDTAETTTTPNTSEKLLSLEAALGNVTEAVFVRLRLWDPQAHGKLLSRNVYWVAKDPDVLDWDNSEWYVTPVSRYADFTALNQLSPAHVAVHAVRGGPDAVQITLENKSAVPAFFVSLNLEDRHGRDVLPVIWDDNYVTLWPGERMALQAKRVGRESWHPSKVQVVGKNLARRSVELS
jgi:exo-1,4-beta-D-glucosaminidase